MRKLLVLAILAVFQSACTVAPLAPTPRRPVTPAPAKRLPPPVAKSYPLPETPPPPKARPYSPPPPPPQPAAESTPPAVVALIRQAEIERRQGNLEQAVAQIERALRIQPQNAELWHALAKIRLEQHQPRLAEELAKKSLSLARGDREISRRNWQLIAEARRINGDIAGARLAEQEASRY